MTAHHTAQPIQVLTITHPGDLWLLGSHRLLCGDSTKDAALKVVLKGQSANMTITDPPYNVNYGNRKTRKTLLMNDNLGDGFYDFLLAACQNIVTHTTGAIYIFMAASEMVTLQKAFKESGGHWSTFIIWAKNHFALSRGDYHRQFEPILYGWAKYGQKYWCGDRKQSDLWRHERTARNKLHPTMKPVALVERAVGNSSKQGDVVLDLFGGSGTTLIACENLERQCRMIEIDPHYVDVIIKRWQDHTGKTAILERNIFTN